MLNTPFKILISGSFYAVYCTSWNERRPFSSKYRLKMTLCFGFHSTTVSTLIKDYCAHCITARKAHRRMSNKKPDLHSKLIDVADPATQFFNDHTESKTISNCQSCFLQQHLVLPGNTVFRVQIPAVARALSLSLSPNLTLSFFGTRPQPSSRCRRLDSTQLNCTHTHMHMHSHTSNPTITTRKMTAF